MARSDTNEMWKAIPNYEQYYQVSNLGRVWSERRQRIMSPGSLKAGYRYVNLQINGISKTRLVGDLVLTSFVSPRPENMEVCHNDGDNMNDVLTNLRWDTHSNNQLDQIKHRTNARAFRTHCPRYHKLVEPNLVHKPNGGKQCKSCARAFAWLSRNEGNLKKVSDLYYVDIMGYDLESLYGKKRHESD